MTETAIATREPKAALVAGGNIAAIIPRNIEEAFRLAGAIYASGMAPASLKSSEQVMIAIMAGAELGFAPFQAVQAFAIINNRPCIWGDAIPALLWSSGFVIEEWFDDDDKATKAFCKVTRPGSGAVTERTFSLDDAKKANLLGKAGTWQTNQKRMLQMRARGFAARDGAADVLKGFQIREEVEDYTHDRDVTPQATGMRARLEARTAVGGFDPQHVSREIDAVLEGDRIPEPDEATGETVETDQSEAAQEPGGANNPAGEEPGLDLAGAGFDAMDWAASFNRGLAQLQTVEEVEAAWLAAKANGFVVKLRAKSEATAKTLADAVNARLAEIGGAAA